MVLTTLCSHFLATEKLAKSAPNLCSYVTAVHNALADEELMEKTCKDLSRLKQEIKKGQCNQTLPSDFEKELGDILSRKEKPDEWELEYEDAETEEYEERRAGKHQWKDNSDL